MYADSGSGSPRGFPPTRASLTAALTSEDPGERRVGLESLIAVYWRPAYAHLRLRWRLESADAEDLVQEFFAAALQQEFFRGYDPDQARLRSFLRLCLDRFASKAHRAERRLKRGGGALHLALDFAGAEAGLDVSDPGESRDDAFDAEWLRALFDAAIEALAAESRADGHEARFEVFRRYDLAPGGAETGRALQCRGFRPARLR